MYSLDVASTTGTALTDADGASPSIQHHLLPDTGKVNAAPYHATRIVVQYPDEQTRLVWNADWINAIGVHLWDGQEIRVLVRSLPGPRAVETPFFGPTITCIYISFSSLIS